MMWKDYLKKIYYDPKSPASFAGASKLWAHVNAEGKYKISKYRIQKWLRGQENYTLTRQVRRSFRRNRVVVEGLDSMWESDLMDLSSLAKDNRGYKYAVVTIDVFSRFVCCRPLKVKTAKDVVAAMRDIFSEGRKPSMLRTDRGAEYQNKLFSDFCRENKVKHFCTQNETKCAYAERVIKTIKMKIYRLTAQKEGYIDKLSDLINSYNRTYHRSIGIQPALVTKENESEIRLQQYLLRPHHTIKKGVYRFKVGDLVRISHLKSKFDREYQQKFTGEIFRIRGRKRRENIPVYSLEDWDKDPIGGWFYSAELQAVDVDPSAPFKIEKILKRRKGQVYVRWLHYPKKFDSWLKASSVKKHL